MQLEGVHDRKRSRKPSQEVNKLEWERCERITYGLVGGHVSNLTFTLREMESH